MVDEIAIHAPVDATRPFVGRKDAVQAFRRQLGATLEGQGRLLMLSGEPGIGKTRCSEEFSRIAEDQGALVLCGRCYEQPGAPAYWPWIQVLRDCLDAHSDDQLRLTMGPGGPLVATLVPELATRLGIEPASSIDAGDGQFRLFDAVSRLLARASNGVPLVLILDDLHWADGSSLGLLEYLSKEVPRQRCLILCAYRDVEVTRRSRLLTTLGELSRGAHVERVRLTGLSADETAELASTICGLPISPAASAAIFQQTDGNPLFVREVAQVLAEELRRATGDFIAVDIPDGIREAIGRSLGRLSDHTNRVLATASVLGREFDLGILARMTGHTPADCFAVLDPAIEAGMLQREVRPSRFRFTHAVIRETLYAELPTLERLQLHRRAAEAVSAVFADQIDHVVSELAFHYGEAAALGDHERAVEFALRAARRAEQVFAIEEACGQYDNALHLLRAAGRSEEREAAECHFEKGRLAVAMGAYGEALETLSTGIGVARALGDIRLFNGFALWLVRVTSYAPQHHAVALVEEALRMLPEHDMGARATTLAHLAFARRATGDVNTVMHTGEEALRLARASGDPSVLAMTLRFFVMGLRGEPGTLAVRLEYGREAVRLADYCELSDEPAEVMYWQLLNLLEAGLADEFAGLLDRYERFTTRRNLLRHRVLAELLRIQLRHLQGDWSGLEELIESALELGRRIERHAPHLHGDGAYGAQMFALNRDLGRLRNLAPIVGRMLEQGSAALWPPGLMLLCCEVGLMDDARTTFEQLAAREFAGVPRDDMWLTCMVYCAETCAALGDAERARLLYQRILPYSGQTASHPMAVCLGAVDLYLGLLAETMSETDRATEHYQAALSMNRSMRAWPMLTRTLVRYGRMLLASELPEQRARGRSPINEAELLATRLGMAGLIEDIRCILDEKSNQLPDGLSPREAEVLKLISIGRSNKDIARALEISLSTVATHVRSILTKSGSANRTEAAAYARRHELA